MPTDCGRIEDHVRASKRREPRALGIPLIPADQSADLSCIGVERAKPEVARGEIELLVKSRIVGNMHFAIKSRNLAVRSNHSGAVVIKTGGSTLKHRSDDCDFSLASYFA